MIIGINGKIGSGKDTVGSIIQYLTYGADKANISYNDWDGQPVWGTENNSFHKSTWEIKKFAGKLKTIASILTGIPVEMFEDQEFKKTFLSREWDTIVLKPGKRQDGLFGKGESEIKQTTVRELLQKLGTEAMRDGLHTNVWVNALFADYVPRLQFEKSFHGMKGAVPVEEPNWIITDMRFPNEMEAVYKREGFTIRVVRQHDVKIQHSGNPNDYTIEKFDETNPKHISLKLGQELNLHPSETALDDKHFDYEIINDGTIEDLIEKVRAILVTEHII